MSFDNFQYTKTWRSKTDFPTYEEREEKVRDDMQCLFDEIAAGLNALAEAIKASNVPFTSTAAISATNVQAAIENVQEQLQNVSIGLLPEGSVNTATLADGAVTNDKTDFSEGFAPAGAIVLTKNVHYFDSEADLPDDAVEGQLAFVKV